MTATPEAIIAAIAEAINAETGYVYEPGDRLLADMAEEAYKAAESLIAEAERARIRQLAAERDAAYRTTCTLRDCPYNPQRHATHLHPFADLLGGDG